MAILAICPLAMAAGTDAAQGQSRPGPAAGGRPGYLDVPGVTQEEIIAIERVKSTRASLVLANELSSELFVKVDGEMGGAGALLCEWLTGFFGIRFEPAVVPWPDIIEHLEDGRADFTAEMNPTPERMRSFIMTRAIAERPVMYMRLPGARPIPEILSERPVRYAFGVKSLNYEMARDSLMRPYEAFGVKDISEAWRALAGGRADAYIAEAPVQASFDPFGEVVSEIILPIVTSEVALSARNPELLPFVSAVARHLEASGNAAFREIYGRGQREYVRDRFNSSLTPGELEWVRRRERGGRPIMAGLEHDNYPASFFNEQEGEFQGIAPDIISEIREITGLDIRNAHERPVSWGEQLRALESGEISLLSELARTPEREGRYLWTDAPYMRDRYAFLSLSGFPDVAVSDVAGLRVGLVEGTAETELFREWFPGHPRTVTYSDNIEPFGGLERGEVDLVMGTRKQALAMTNLMERPNFKVNLTLEEVSFDSYFGVAPSQPELRSILSKAQRQIDVEAIESAWRTRVFDYRGALARTRMPLMAGGFALLTTAILLLMVMFVRSLRSGRALEEAVADRTRELSRQIDISDGARRAKGDFLARTSHEIRTPMNAIIGFSELASREYGKPKSLEYIHGIRSAGASLLTIINDILDFSKIESGNLQLAPARYRASSVLNDAVTLIRVRMGDKPLRLDLEVSPDIPSSMIGDSGRIRQILLNLLSNAVKYTEQGRIRLSARAERLAVDEARLAFEVEDTGIGIRPEDLKRLFGEFTRLDERRNSAVEGTGLGLAIARSLCRAMGGDISAESEYGKGSIFRAAIVQKVADWTPMGPLAEEHGEAGEQSRVSFTAPSAEVLVVDDYASNLMVAEGLLAPYGMRLSFASGGLESVGLVREHAFDLVLMDHMMPEMDGIEAMKAIRAIDGCAGLTIVALTANAVVGMREMYLEQGFDDFLSKPIDPAALDTLLFRWIPCSKLREPPAPPEDPPCAEAASPPPLPRIQGLDSARGAARAGGPERFMRLLETFRRDAQGSFATLAIPPRNMEQAGRLAIVAHALKTALANIGAGPLSARAAALEAACRELDLSFIERRLPSFRGRLERLSRSIMELSGEGADGGPGGGHQGDSADGQSARAANGPDERREALKALVGGLIGALEKQDFPKVDAELGRLSEAAAPAGLKRAVEAIADDILVGDYEKALEALGDLEGGSSPAP
ncbi:MAG: transporter substrate-binding domain-containing protein [Deltaproteobacteria bacterium]|nr:transporter substrate-binding domain-containing protein [Deltaproteobacteria bacterium]